MIRLRPSGLKFQVSGLLCALSLALFAGCASPASAQQALKVDPDTGQLVEPTTLLIGANQTFTTSANATVRLPAITGPVAISGNFTLSGFGEWNEGALDLRNYSGGYYRFKAGDNYLSFTELDSAKENATDLGGFDYSNDYTRFKVGGQYPGQIALWDIGYNDYTTIRPSDEGTLFIGPWELVTNAPGVRLSPPARDGVLAINAIPAVGPTVALPGLDYYVVADAVFTDPAAGQGAYFWVTVRTGTATIGGQDFAQQGTRILRLSMWDGAAYVWVTYPYFTTSSTPLTGNLTVAQGGTGQTTLTSGSLLTGNATGPLTLIAPGTSGNVLTSNGTAWISAAPSGGGGGNITINTSSPLTINGGTTATTSNATLAISTATTSTSGIVPTLGSATDRTGAPTRRQLLSSATTPIRYTFSGISGMGVGSSSGSGTSSGALGNMGAIRMNSGAAAGARNNGAQCVFAAWSSSSYLNADWSIPLQLSGIINIDHSGTAATDTRIRAGFGKANSFPIGALATRGFVIEARWTGSVYEIFCGVHNGTTLNIQTTGITMAKQNGVVWSVEADGAGNAVWYVHVGATNGNGITRTSATLTQTGAPTGTESATRCAFIEIDNGAAGGASLLVDFLPMQMALGF